MGSWKHEKRKRVGERGVSYEEDMGREGGRGKGDDESGLAEGVKCEE